MAGTLRGQPLIVGPTERIPGTRGTVQSEYCCTCQSQRIKRVGIFSTPRRVRVGHDGGGRYHRRHKTHERREVVCVTNAQQPPPVFMEEHFKTHRLPTRIAYEYQTPLWYTNKQPVCPLSASRHSSSLDFGFYGIRKKILKKFLDFLPAVDRGRVRVFAHGTMLTNGSATPEC